MRPVPFPEPYRSVLVEAGAEFQVWAAPGGSLTDDEVRPVEAARYKASVAGAGEEVREGQEVISVVIQLDDGDLEMLQETRMFEFGVWGGALPVFFFVPLRKPTPEEMGDVEKAEKRPYWVDAYERMTGKQWEPGQEWPSTLGPTPPPRKVGE